MKITFKDTSATQYDDNATEIQFKKSNKETGRLYLGDRLSASYVQLKHRKCSVVVNCSRPLHGFSKEPDVEYMNIDPIAIEDDIKISDMWNDSYVFIKNALKSQKNVLVCCETGEGKSGVVMIHYLMRRYNISLGDSYEYVLDKVPNLKVRSQLMKKLIELDVKYNGIASVSIKNKNEYVVSNIEKITSKTNSDEKKKKKMFPNKVYYVFMIMIVVVVAVGVYMWKKQVGGVDAAKPKRKSYSSYSKSHRNVIKNFL